MTTETEKKWPIHKSQDEWLEKLSPEQYHVTREAGTEMPFKGPYLDDKSEVLFIVFAAVHRFFHLNPNLIVALAGRVSFSPLIPKILLKILTHRMA